MGRNVRRCSMIVTRKHVNALIWTLALFCRAVIALFYLAIALRFDFSDVERIGNHAMSIYFDSFYVLTIGVWLFRDTLAKRVVFPLMLPLMLYVFLANHRRSSFIAFGIALLLIAYLLFDLKRRLFWRVVPALSL